MIVNIHKFFILLLFLVCSTLVTAQNDSQQANLADSISIGSEYRFSPGDVVSVTVFGEPDISVASMRVPLSGGYNYPLIGELNLVGETATSLAKALEAKLRAGFLSDPKVSVNIVRYRPVIVTGSVDTTGTIDYQEGMTVRILSALAQVENVNSIDISAVEIQRDSVVFNPQSLETTILPGDIVSYSFSEKSDDFYYIYGEVNRSGKYELEDSLTVEQAIIVAGGYSPFASKKNIRIRRAGEEDSIKVKLIEQVKPGDVITIKKRWF